MRITCIGMGFVGVVASAVFAKLGHNVKGLDIDKNKISSLSRGRPPFFEPGLSSLLKEALASKKLSFTTSYREAVADSEIIFIMVGTPSLPDGQADLKYVFAVAKSISHYLRGRPLLVIKSTVPPGTNKKIERIIKENTTVPFAVASGPEFLKEGTAVEDMLHPDRIIIGIDDNYAKKILVSLYRPLTANILIMKPESAQMAKYAANLYLAQRITFINQIANLCEKNGADIEEVIQGIGSDRRIGSHYWYPGLGYGGSCFPKDVKEIAAYSKRNGEADNLFVKVDELNERRIDRVMYKYDRLVGGFSGKTVAVLGLSFKPGTDDMRVAPSLRVIPYLIKSGATVRAADPQAVNRARRLLPEQVRYFQDPYQAVRGSQVMMLLIEWEQYKNMDLSRLSDIMRPPKYFIDTRNQYCPRAVADSGLKYRGTGR